MTDLLLALMQNIPWSVSKLTENTHFFWCWEPHSSQIFSHRRVFSHCVCKTYSCGISCPLPVLFLSFCFYRRECWRMASSLLTPVVSHHPSQWQKLNDSVCLSESLCLCCSFLFFFSFLDCAFMKVEFSVCTIGSVFTPESICHLKRCLSFFGIYLYLCHSPLRVSFHLLLSHFLFRLVISPLRCSAGAPVGSIVKLSQVV